VAGLDGRAEFSLGFKTAAPTGNVHEREAIEDAALLPLKGETFWVARGWINCIRRDARFAGGGDVEAPIFVAAADREVAVE